LGENENVGNTGNSFFSCP